MGIRPGKMVWLVLGILASSGWLAGPAFATGAGTQADPFIVYELTYDVYFAVQGNGRICINGNCLYSSSGNVKPLFNQQLQSGGNTVSIYSDWGHNDCCFSCDKAVAVMRIGSDTDGNIIYTERSGWMSTTSDGTPTPDTIIEQPGTNGCAFSSNVNLPWTEQEKCVNTAICSVGSIDFEEDCCVIELSRTFYVSYCQCSAAGPWCAGCNYTSSGSNCGPGTCPYDSYYQASGSCYKTDYPDSCAKTCDSSGNCQDCLCTHVNSQVGWPSCGACQEIDYSSCQGATGPMCKNSPAATPCGTKDCGSGNGYIQLSSNCYYRTYSPCTKTCDGSGPCQG